MSWIKKIISALIDTYSLEDCIAVLALCAPDILAMIEDDVRHNPHDPMTLEKARRAVHEARARENRMN